MITGENEKLTEITKDNVCAEHHKRLNVAWHSGQKCWVIICGAGEYPDAVTRQRDEREDEMLDKTHVTETRLSLVPRTDLATGEVLSPETVNGLVSYAKKYKLDPERGHVVLMYGKPYITIDGYLYHARKTGRSYSLESRPMTTTELENYKLGPTDHGWICTVNILKPEGKFTGIGIVTYQEMTEPGKRDPNIPAHPVVAKHPGLLGQKRAEWQALRRAFPIGGEE